MARKPRWKQHPLNNGVLLVELLSWKYFLDFIDRVLRTYPNYIWRGHRCDSWKLEPTLDRLARAADKTLTPEMREEHLQSFKFAARGRRGPHPPPIQTENEWWALGQHFGLATPLLDWTASPFSAAYFAFIGQGTEQTHKRVIFGLSIKRVTTASENITADWKGEGRAPIVELVRPMSDENPRLVSQGGLFTRAPDNVDMETWVRSNAVFPRKVTLIKVTIPNDDREHCLQTLNRMNINHLSLFPDLYGASRFCNLALEIPDY